MNATLQIALIRGVMVAIIAAGAAFFAALGSGVTVDQAAIAAGGAFFATLAARAGAEGAWDSQSTIQRAADDEKATH